MTRVSETDPFAPQSFTVVADTEAFSVVNCNQESMGRVIWMKPDGSDKYVWAWAHDFIDTEWSDGTVESPKYRVLPDGR